jgi:hypothetical protein
MTFAASDLRALPTADPCMQIPDPDCIGVLPSRSFLSETPFGMEPMSRARPILPLQEKVLCTTVSVSAGTSAGGV